MAYVRLFSLFCMLAWILAFPTRGDAQPSANFGDTLTQQQFITGCAAYRQSVIQGIETLLSEFVSLTNILSKNSSNPEPHLALRDIVLKGALQDDHGITMGAIFNAVGDFAPEDSAALRIYKDWIATNNFALSELQFLVSNEILDAEPPFKLGSLRTFWQEFSFYGVHANMTLADIGTGNGVISFILAESGLPLQIILTEVSPYFLIILEDKVRDYLSRNPKDTLILIKGGEKDLNFENLNADIIILREVYHHLRYKKAMLEDIRIHLNDKGYLILKEGTKDLKKKGERQCIKATTLRKILKEVKATGFLLVDHQIIEDSHLLKFRKSS